MCIQNHQWMSESDPADQHLTCICCIPLDFFTISSVLLILSIITYSSSIKMKRTSLLSCHTTSILQFSPSDSVWGYFYHELVAFECSVSIQQVHYYICTACPLSPSVTTVLCRPRCVVPSHTSMSGCTISYHTCASYLWYTAWKQFSS
jgi:hypothetical protein